MILKKNGIEYEFIKKANNESKEKSTLVFIHGPSSNKKAALVSNKILTAFCYIFKIQLLYLFYLKKYLYISVQKLLLHFPLYNEKVL